MSNINKLYNIWVKNENLISGTYGNVSFLTQAKGEINTLTTTALGVGCADPSINYILDVSGNQRVRGNLDVSGIITNTISTTTIGIGCADPSINYILDVSGNQRVRGNLDISGVITSPWLDASLNARAYNASTVHLDGTETISGDKTFSGNLVATPYQIKALGGIDMSNTSLGNPSAIRMFGGSIQTNGGIYFQAQNLYRKLTLYPGTSNGECTNYSIGVNNTNLEQVYMVPDNTRSHKFCYGTGTSTKEDILILKNDTSIFNSDVSLNANLNCGLIKSTWLDTSLNTRALDAAVVHNTGAETIIGAKTFSNGAIFNSGLTSTGITLNGNLVNATSLRLGTAAYQVSGSLHFPATTLFRKIILYPVSTNEYQNYSIGVDDVANTTQFMVPDSTKKYTFSYGTSTTAKNDILILRNTTCTFYTDVSLNGNLNCGKIISTWLDTSLNAKAVDTAVVHNTGTETITGLKIFNTDISLNANLNCGLIKSTWLDSSLNAKAVDTAVVHNTGNEIIGGNKEFTADTSFNSLVRFSQIRLDNSYIYRANDGGLTGATTITKPWNEVVPVKGSSTNYTITLPTLTTDDLGSKILFRRTSAGTGTISFQGDGSQKVYNTALSGGTTAQGLMTSTTYIVEFVVLRDDNQLGGNLAWHQI